MSVEEQATNPGPGTEFVLGQRYALVAVEGAAADGAETASCLLFRRPAVDRAGERGLSPELPRLSFAAGDLRLAAELAAAAGWEGVGGAAVALFTVAPHKGAEGDGGGRWSCALAVDGLEFQELLPEPWSTWLPSVAGGRV